MTPLSTLPRGRPLSSSRLGTRALSSRPRPRLARSASVRFSPCPASSARSRRAPPDMALEEDVSFTVGPIASLFSGARRPHPRPLRLTHLNRPTAARVLLLEPDLWAPPELGGALLGSRLPRRVVSQGGSRHWLAVCTHRYGAQLLVGLPRESRGVSAGDTRTEADFAVTQWAVSFYISPAQLEVLPWQLTVYCFS